jgi:hypothetical protein
MNYLIEYAVRRYIDEKKLFDGRKDYHLSIKTGGIFEETTSYSL